MYTMATSCGLHGVSSWFWQHSASQMRLCVHLTLTPDCRTASCGKAAHLTAPPLVRAPLLGALMMGSRLAWDVLSYRPVWGNPGERASSSVRCSWCVVSGLSSFSSSDSGGDNWTRQGVRGGHAGRALRCCSVSERINFRKPLGGGMQGRAPNITRKTVYPASL